MLLLSPKDLHYPITVTELLKRPSDGIDKFAPLFSYYYKSTVTEWNRYGEEFEVEKSFPTRYESETDGTLREWRIRAGSVIARAGLPLVEIEEPCSHEIQFGGMCANCGKDMTEVAYNTSTLDSARAPINMIHGNTALTVSQAEANRAEEEAKKRLLAGKKLSLVVDLDQTIIHATVDPTVGEWQRDPENPNHDAVKDVRAFQLLDDGPGARGCWYYIKLRPGLQRFLENISEIYELHIYTMGTRAYAQNIAKIVDPKQKIFGDRILSRDESGSMVAKSLRRLFPVDTKMVVIIDDRGDVWSWSENLVKVPAYDFFVGIGDINSSFLPKLPEQNGTGTTESPKPENEGKSNVGKDAIASASTTSAAPKTAEPKDATQNKETDQVVSVLEKQFVSMGGGDDKAVREEQSHQQEETIAAQVSDRPLAQKQQRLDKVDEEAAELGDDVDETQRDNKPRHNLLQDTDAALDGLEASLSRVHQAFYDIYEQRLEDKKKNASSSELQRTTVDLESVPDVKDIISAMKREVLSGKELVFSGVIPLGLNIHLADIVMWSKDFGATISEYITKRTTHVIASKQRKTAKVRQAARHPRIKIVSVDWLHESFVQWTHVDETRFAIHNEPEEANSSTQPTEVMENSSILEDVEDVDLSSGGEGNDDDQDNKEFERGDSGGGGPVINNSQLTITTINTTPTATQDTIQQNAELAALEPTSPMEDNIGGTDQDWQNMQDEMEEWLAEDGDDSGSEDGKNDKASPSSNSSNVSDDDGGGERRERRSSDGATSEESSRKRKRPPTASSTAGARPATKGSAKTDADANTTTSTEPTPSPSNDTTDTEESDATSKPGSMSKLQRRKRRALERVSSLNRVTNLGGQADGEEANDEKEGEGRVEGEGVDPMAKAAVRDRGGQLSADRDEEDSSRQDGRGDGVHNANRGNMSDGGGTINNHSDNTDGTVSTKEALNTEEDAAAALEAEMEAELMKDGL